MTEHLIEILPEDGALTPEQAQLSLEIYYREAQLLEELYHKAFLITPNEVDTLDATGLSFYMKNASHLSWEMSAVCHRANGVIVEYEVINEDFTSCFKQSRILNCYFDIKNGFLIGIVQNPRPDEEKYIEFKPKNIVNRDGYSPKEIMLIPNPNRLY